MIPSLPYVVVAPTNTVRCVRVTPHRQTTRVNYQDDNDWLQLSHVEVLQRRWGQDINHLDDVLVVEVPQQPDLPHDTLRVHQVVESPGNFLDSYLCSYRQRQSRVRQRRSTTSSHVAFSWPDKPHLYRRRTTVRHGCVPSCTLRHPPYNMPPYHTNSPQSPHNAFPRLSTWETHPNL